MFGSTFSVAPLSSLEPTSATLFVSPAHAAAAASAVVPEETHTPAAAIAASAAIVNIISLTPPWASASSSVSVDVISIDDEEIILTPELASAASSASIGVIAGESSDLTPSEGSATGSAHGPTVVLGNITTTPAFAVAASSAQVTVSESVIIAAHQIISIQSYIRNYQNFVAYQTEAGELKVAKGYGPSPPTTSAAATDTIVAISSYIRAMDSYVVYENGRGEVMVAKGYGPTAVTSPAATDVMSIYSYESPGGTQVVVTENGAGTIKISKDPR
jgi:hypothetical protein